MNRLIARIAVAALAVITTVAFARIAVDAMPAPATDNLNSEVHNAYRYAAHCGGVVIVHPIWDGTPQEHRIGAHDVTVEGCDQ